MADNSRDPQNVHRRLHNGRGLLEFLQFSTQILASDSDPQPMASLRTARWEDIDFSDQRRFLASPQVGRRFSRVFPLG